MTIDIDRRLISITAQGSFCKTLRTVEEALSKVAVLDWAIFADTAFVALRSGDRSLLEKCIRRIVALDIVNAATGCDRMFPTALLELWEDALSRDDQSVLVYILGQLRCALHQATLRFRQLPADDRISVHRAVMALG